MQKGTFWFAAGLSFNSFALVGGIAVMGMQIGDGLDINLLGLARMRTAAQVALVSIELALLVRFSSARACCGCRASSPTTPGCSIGHQAHRRLRLRDLVPRARRPASSCSRWGGYHPDFHRDGYPVVPRLGLRWSIAGNIVINGLLLALTSEALMAGGDFEASAHFGPAWAEVKFGAHGIVYFDPFHYDVMAYARIAAGVTIDTWLFGEITISISRGARIHVLGPDFRGSVTFEVGPIELTFEFGSGKEQAADLGRRVHRQVPWAADSGRRVAAVDQHRHAAGQGRGVDADGSSARPAVVVVEFSMTFTSTARQRR